jgi:hypothetical protein
MLMNCHPLKVKIKNSYISNLSGYEEGYLIAVSAIPNQQLTFTVHLQSGALFSSVPIEAILCEKFGATASEESVQLEGHQLQPWTCLEDPSQLLVYDYLENYDTVCKIEDQHVNGNYIMTISYSGRGLADDPEQSKTHNIIVLENGQLAALPNNYILFKDQFFTTKELEFPKHYRRKSKWYFSN